MNPKTRPRHRKKMGEMLVEEEENLNQCFINNKKDYTVFLCLLWPNSLAALNQTKVSVASAGKKIMMILYRIIILVSR